jgi:plasmid stability protein
MSSITIRNFDSSVKERLRTRAAENGRSMEAEARCILEAALKLPARAGASNLFERIRALVDRSPSSRRLRQMGFLKPQPILRIAVGHRPGLAAAEYRVRGGTTDPIVVAR